MIDLGPALEQNLIDFKPESPPIDAEDETPEPFCVSELDPTAIEMGDPMQVPHAGFRTLDRQFENQPSKRVCLIKPVVRRVINSLQCGGHQIMSEMKSCTENTTIPLKMYHKYLRSKVSTMEIRKTKGSVDSTFNAIL